MLFLPQIIYSILGAQILSFLLLVNSIIYEDQSLYKESS